VHLRLFCPDRQGDPRGGRLPPVGPVVVRQRLRPVELGLSRRLHQAGRRAGTGSKDIVARDVFVPAHRVLMFADARAGTTPGARYHKNPLYKMPLLIHGASMLASTAVGAARGALDAFREMTAPRRTRGALAGGQLPMIEFATIQLRYAEAAAQVEA